IVRLCSVCLHLAETKPDYLYRDHLGLVSAESDSAGAEGYRAKRKLNLTRVGLLLLRIFRPGEVKVDVVLVSQGRVKLPIGCPPRSTWSTRACARIEAEANLTSIRSELCATIGSGGWEQSQGWRRNRSRLTQFPIKVSDQRLVRGWDRIGDGLRLAWFLIEVDDVWLGVKFGQEKKFTYLDCSDFGEVVTSMLRWRILFDSVVMGAFIVVEVGPHVGFLSTLDVEKAKLRMSQQSKKERYGPNKANPTKARSFPTKACVTSYPFVSFAYTRMPFGMCNAPSTFKLCMTSIFSDLLQDYMEVFMDDFIVYANSFDACLENLSKVLTRCIDTNLEVRSFLRHVRFYRRFIKNFSKIALPLSKML
ncbi:Retrovirus-related Pol polyprotein from transposon 17.6, partial [Mucuna pruriens]